MRYRLDSSAQRLDDGRALLAGSPLVLFRLSDAGARLLDLVIEGRTLPRRSDRLTGRLLDAGALHPDPEPGSGRFSPRDVTVVIPVRDGDPAGAVDAARAAGVAEVIVVDDGSGTPVAARAAVVRREVNGGPGAARNTGLAEVSTPLVAFVDVDCTPGAGWLDAILPHFDDESVALVAPRITGAPGPGPLARYEEGRSPLDLGPEPARVRAGTRVSYVPAACLVARADALRALSGFDEDLRTGEDVDLVWRLDESGRRVRYDPAAHAVHAPRTTFGGWWRQRVSYGRSAAPLARRHPGALAPVRVSGWSATVWALAGIGAVVPLRARRRGWLRRGRPARRRSAGAGRREWLRSRRPARSAGGGRREWLRRGRPARKRSARAGAVRLVLGFVPAAGVATGTTVALARKLRGLPEPNALAVRLAGLGHLHAGRQLASAITRVWWPVAIVAALRSRRARVVVAAAALLPPLADWAKARPKLDPGSYVVLRLLDDAAYGTGVWLGAWDERTIEPLVPDLTSWPRSSRYERARAARFER
jgi:mycofactocin glycosyltransferase